MPRLIKARLATAVGSCPVGDAVVPHQGASRPDVGTVKASKQALLAATPGSVSSRSAN
jgi:hypothetical protein